MPGFGFVDVQIRSPKAQPLPHRMRTLATTSRVREQHVTYTPKLTLRLGPLPSDPIPDIPKACSGGLADVGYWP